LATKRFGTIIFSCDGNVHLVCSVYSKRERDLSGTSVMPLLDDIKVEGLERSMYEAAAGELSSKEATTFDPEVSVPGEMLFEPDFARISGLARSL